MQDLYYKDTRVSPTCSLGLLLIELQNPKLSAKDRTELNRRADLIYQECEAEYLKWGNK